MTVYLVEIKGNEPLFESEAQRQCQTDLIEYYDGLRQKQWDKVAEENAT